MGCGVSTEENLKNVTYTKRLSATFKRPSVKKEENTNYFSSLFIGGNNLLTKEQSTVVSEFLIQNLDFFKILCLYFGSNNNKETKEFTPKLINAYKSWKDREINIEVVYITSDTSDSDFKNAYNDMPWLALQKDDRDVHLDLKRKFNVIVIPKLIVVSYNGQILEENAIEVIENYPEECANTWDQEVS